MADTVAFVRVGNFNCTYKIPVFLWMLVAYVRLTQCLKSAWIVDLGSFLSSIVLEDPSSLLLRWVLNACRGGNKHFTHTRPMFLMVLPFMVIV